VLGGVILLFLCAFEAMLYAYRGQLPDKPVHTASPDPMLLFKKPPTIAFLFLLSIHCIPIAAIEPGLEPYLTAPPFNMTVEQVGLCLLIISVVDVVGAVITSPLQSIFGQIPILYATSAMMMLSLFGLALGPQTWVAVQLSFAPQSLGQLPLFVMAPAVMMRICRTYGLDPKDYAEIYMSIIAGLVAPIVAVFSVVAGAMIDAIGYRHWYLILAISVCSGPLVICWGFSPRTMGRPMAEMADESTDTEQHKERTLKLEQLEQEKRDKRDGFCGTPSDVILAKNGYSNGHSNGGSTDAKKARDVRAI